MEQRKKPCPWEIRTYIERQGKDEYAGSRPCKHEAGHEGKHE